MKGRFYYVWNVSGVANNFSSAKDITFALNGNDRFELFNLVIIALNDGLIRIKMFNASLFGFLLRET
jgi:hypothetical protein